MALAIYSTKFASNINTHKLHDQGIEIRAETRKLAAKNKIGGRRELLLLSSSTSILAAAVATDQANDTRTALLQKYLKKSEDNKDKNDKERLDGYYKRNYKDYFEFVEGSLMAKDDQQLSEAEKGILDWLQKNK